MKTILFCVFFFPLTCLSQPKGVEHSMLTIKLDSLLIAERDTNNFIKVFESLPVDSLWDTEILLALRAYAGRRDVEKFNYYAKFAFEKGQDGEILQSYCSRIAESEKDQLLEMELEGKKKYFKTVEKELFDEIFEMNRTDAQMRDLHFANRIQYSVVRVLDSVHLSRLKFLINKYGMITEKKHGVLFHLFFYLIIHCCYYENNDFEWMRKLFYNAVMQGDADPNLYAYYVDRWWLITKKGMMYGSVGSIDTIIDRKNVDARRKEIGTCDLATWRKIRKGRM